MFNVCHWNGGSGEDFSGGGLSGLETAVQARQLFRIFGKYILSRIIDLVLVIPRWPSCAM